MTALLQDTVVGDGMAGEVGAWADKNLERVRFIQIRFEGTRTLRQASLNNRLIFFFRLVPVPLQGFLGFWGFGEDHQSGRLAIEAVNDPHPLF